MTSDHCFDWKGPYFGVVKAKNRGQIGSRYIYIHTHIYIYIIYIEIWVVP